jgi:hypothetical protein
MPNLRRCCATVCVLAVSGALLAGCRDDHDSSSSTATEPVPSAPPVAGDPVVDRPVFNDPNSDRASRRAAVLLQLARLISEVPGGGTIELAMHQFDVQHAMVEKQIVRALVGRARHGVRVRVLLDGGNLGAGHTTPNHALRMLRGGFRGTSSWVATCSDRTPSIRHRGCIGSRANHNKFGLFSAVRTSNGTRYRVAGQCSVFQGGGEGPRGEGRQGPSGALNRPVLLLDVLLHHAQRCPANRAREVRTRPELVGPVVVPDEIGELLP